MAACLAALLAAGCATPPPPLALPASELSVNYQPWAKPDPAKASPPKASPTAASAFPTGRRVLLRAVASIPDGMAIASAATSISNDQGTPFRGRSSLPIGTRWLSHDNVLAWMKGDRARTGADQQELGSAEALISASWTSTVHAELGVIETVLDGTMSLPKLQLRNTPNGLRVALRVAATEQQPEELLTLQQALQNEDSAGVFVPDERAGEGGLLLLLMPAAIPGRDALAVADAAIKAAAQPPSATPALPASWQLVRDAVGERNRRPALLALAEPLGAMRVTDLVLSADEATLIAISKRVEQVDPNDRDLAWSIERASWRALIRQIERGELPASLHAASERLLGAVADDPGTLQILLQTSGDPDTFSHNLGEENLAALTDRKASVRVAAQTWLASHSITVPDYDPMADRSTLRKTVRRFLAQRERTLREQRAKEEAR